MIRLFLIIFLFLFLFQRVSSQESWVLDTLIYLDNQHFAELYVLDQPIEAECHLCQTEVRLEIREAANCELVSNTPLEVYTLWGGLYGDFKLLNYQGHHALAFTTGDGGQGNFRTFIQIFDLDKITGKPFKEYHYLTICDHGSNFMGLPKVVQEEYKMVNGGDTLDGEDWMYHKGVLRDKWSLQEDGRMLFEFYNNTYSFEPVYQSGGREFMEYHLPSYQVIKAGPWSNASFTSFKKLNADVINSELPQIDFYKGCSYLSNTAHGVFLRE